MTHTRKGTVEKRTSPQQRTKTVWPTINLAERIWMTKIEGSCRNVCDATELVTIVTTENDGPHVVGNRGGYRAVLCHIE